MCGRRPCGSVLSVGPRRLPGAPSCARLRMHACMHLPTCCHAPVTLGVIFAHTGLVAALLIQPHTSDSTSQSWPMAMPILQQAGQG
jgi:hypothetical protein